MNKAQLQRAVDGHKAASAPAAAAEPTCNGAAPRSGGSGAAQVVGTPGE